MKHLMIDLETMGTDADAVICSIGACFFDPTTGEVGDQYYTRIEWEDGVQTGRSTTINTQGFWAKQGKEVAKEIFDHENRATLEDTLDHFKGWVLDRSKSAIVWGNGATFDISMLENAYGGGDFSPWKFWNIRDVRTICELADHKINKKSFPFVGAPHHALDDSLHQVKYVSAMYKFLKGINHETA